MSSPVVGYATMPIVPSLKGLDAEINRQLSGGTLERSATLAGQKTGAAFNRGFGTNSNMAEVGRAAGVDLDAGFTSAIAASGAASAFGRSLRSGAGEAAAVGTEYASEFSAAVTTQLLSLPKAQADRLAEQLRSDAAKQKAAGAAASRSWLGGFNDGLRRGRADLDALGIDEAALTSFGTKTLAAGAIAAFGLGKAAQAAGDLNAAVSASGQVFGRAQGDIEAWSDGSADAIGLSQRAAIEAATSFGAFGKQAGLQGPELSQFSTGLTELAADLAAFKNVSIDEALQALQSGLAGETEPLRKYQVLLSDAQLRQEAVKLGIQSTTTEALTPQNRVLAANSLIYAQATDKIGQFGREQGELGTTTQQLAANFENAQAALGEALLPALTGAAGAAADTLKWFTGLNDTTQGVSSGILAVGAAGAVGVGGLSLLVGGGLKAYDSINALWTRVGDVAPWQRFSGAVRTSNGALGAFRGTARGAVIAAGAAAGVGILADQLYGLTQSAEDVEAALNRLKLVPDTASLDEAFAALNGFAEERLSILDRLNQPVSGQDDILGVDGEVLSNLTRVNTVLENLLKNKDPETLKATLDVIREAAELDVNAGVRPELLAAVDSYTRAMSEQERVRQDSLEGADAQADSDKALADAQKELDAATSSLTRKQALLGFQFESNAAAAQGYLTAVERSGSTNALVRAGVGVGSALRQVRDGLTGEASAADAAEDSTDTLSVALERMNDALEWGNPQLSIAAIELGAFKAAADGFRNSMENSSGLRNQVSAAIGLGEAYRDFSMVARRLPGEIDMVALTLGEYRPRTVEAIQATLALGSAFSDYLGSLLEAGRGTEYVRSEANRFRGELAAQLRQAGLTEAQVESYLQVLNATPEAVETAIRVSGDDAARFKIQSLLQLLEGRIPESVALSVTNAISLGDLEGAARQLQQVAASNPVKIPLEVDGGSVADVEADLLRLPPTIDFVTAALGGYSEEQERGIEAMLGLGDAAQEFISKLVGDGRTEEAKQFARDLRSEVYDLAIQMGATDEGARDLLETLGLEGWQVEAGITLAGFDRTVFEVTTLLSLLDEDLSAEKRLEIAASISKGDYDGAMEAIRGEIAALESDNINLRVEALTDPATGKIDIWRVQTENGVFPVIGVDANTGLAYEDVDEFRRWAASQPALVQVDADTRLAQEKLRATFGGALIGLLPGGVDGDPRTPYRDGGLVTGPGTGRSDSIAAWLSNGEFVIPELRVRQYGLDFLESLRAGRLDSKAKTPAGLTLHSGPRIDVSRWDSLATVPADTGGGATVVNYNPTYQYQQQREPTAHDVIRDWNSAIHRGDIRWPD